MDIYNKTFSGKIIIIRPSGVWNSRDPLKNYILERQQLSKSSNVLALAVYALRHDAQQELDQTISARRFLKRVVKTEAMANEAWQRYRRSFPNSSDKSFNIPIETLSEDARSALYDVREMSIIRLSSIFESYAQCWALNYVAGSLENCSHCPKIEMELIRKFNPFEAKGRLPSWYDILRHLDFLEPGLRKLPHCFRHPLTQEELSEPVSNVLNALSVIDFWRAYRNLSIHKSRIVTWGFHDRFGDLFLEMVRDLKYSADLEPGKRMPMHGNLYSQMAAALYRAAIWMDEKLVHHTNRNRGSLCGISSPSQDSDITDARSGAMFRPGDHEASWNWIDDYDFRHKTAAASGWTLK